jgi:L-iditol 2-dehydrogenase
MVNICDHKTVLGVSVDGGYAQYCRVKVSSALRLPENLSYEEGVFAEPLACALYGMNKLGIEQGQTCIIIGPGPIGLLMVQIARLSGAGSIILVGTRDYRLEMGLSLGADQAINTATKDSKYYVPNVASFIAHITEGRMAERVITPTSDIAAMRLALEISGKRSVIVFFGDPGQNVTIAIPVHSSLAQEKTIRFSVRTAFTWSSALDLLGKGLVKVKPLLTHRFGLEDFCEGLRKMEQHKDNIIKAVIVPGDVKNIEKL